jgi:hypothetical protein
MIVFEWVGRMLDHVAWPDHYEENDFTETNKQWKQEFGINIEEEHQMDGWREGAFIIEDIYDDDLYS